MEEIPCLKLLKTGNPYYCTSGYKIMYNKGNPLLNRAKMEVWKDIEGYEELYQVSNLGRVQSKEHSVLCRGNKTRVVKGKIRAPQLNPKGYSIVVLCKNNKLKTFTVHQLVAQAFIPGFIKGTEINHKDGNKANPHVDNLEVSNRSHNQLHAVRIGLKSKVGISQYNNVSYVNNPRAKARWAASIRHEGNSSYGWKTFMTEVEAAKHVDTLLNSIGDTQRLRNFP